jgi:pyruvate/2-oxoglutarate dehydrogenase complex dihydrolipoamide acyltransferase (E2) component
MCERIAPRPVVHDGEVVVRPMGNVSVTFDHRSWTAHAPPSSYLP